MNNKKITAIVLTVIMLFSCTVPVCAAAAQPVAETEQIASVSIVEKIKDLFHRIIEGVLRIFGIDCPFCEEDYVPVTGDETVIKYNDGVNAVKNYTGTVTVKKVENISVRVQNLPSVAESIISAVAENFAGTNESKWTFTDGKSIEGAVIGDKVEPCTREASLAYAGVASAESTDTAVGGSKIKITLMPEQSVFDGATVTEDAVYNAAVLSTVNYGALDLGPIVVHTAETAYTGTVLEAEFDTHSRIIFLKITSPMDILFTAKAGISITGTAHADVTTEYTFTYWS